MMMLLSSQRGGVMILMVLAFMSLGVPVITGTLKLATTLSIDSQVKTDALRRQYCSLAVSEYIRYLTLDTQRWADWWAAHPDGSENIGACGDGAPNGIVFDLDGETNAEVTTGDGELLGLGQLGPPGYSNRRIQTLKTVVATDEAQSLDKTPFTYTITLINRDDSQANLNQIHDTLPPGLKYNCAANSTILLADGVTQQTLSPDPDPGGDGCPLGPLDRHIVWDTTFLAPLQPGESVALTFEAVRAGGLLSDGNYCNEAWAASGDANTTTGKTASVKVGGVADNVCAGGEPGVLVTKTVSVVSSVVPGGSSNTYLITVEYTITIENIGAVPLTLGPGGGTNYGLRDLLPLGVCYVGPTLYSDPTVSAADLVPNTQIPTNTCPNPDQRQRADWDFTNVIPSGETRTLTYTATGDIATGAYWSDLLVNFSGLAEAATYTWPTAGILVEDDYTASITLDGRSIGSCDVSQGSDGSASVDCEIN